MKTARSLVAGVVALAVAIGAVIAWPVTGSRDSAPAVAYTLLDGNRGELQALRGKVVLVNFWAAMCRCLLLPAMRARRLK